jgi:hypothetical protein
MSVKNQVKAIANRMARGFLRRRPIRGHPKVFLLGHDRSGSTWIGSILGEAERSIYLHEPMNRKTSRMGDWDLYNCHLKAGEPETRLEHIYDAAARGYGPRLLSLKELRWQALSRPTVIIKETGGMLLGEWFQHRYGGRVAILFRHPAPLILSNLRMGEANGRKWFQQLEAQPKIKEIPEIMEGLRDFESSDPVELFAAGYCIRYLVTLRQMEKNPEWLRFHHEDFCMEPEATFRDAFQRLGLTFGENARAALGASSRSDGSTGFFGLRRDSREVVHKWHKKCSAKMEKTIRRQLERFSFPYYQRDEDWERSRN